MNLIDILVEELPKRGGWPKSTNCITQDGDLKVEPAYCHPSVAKCGDDGFWFLDSSRIGGFKVDTLASDYTTAIITREQYEAALAASKRCDHKWIPSEGRTQSGYLCSKCGNYDGPGYDWIDWGGGECPVLEGVLVEVKYRNEKNYHIKGVNRAGRWSWAHYGTDGDIIAYRLHQPKEAEQAKADDEDDLNECIGQATAPLWNGEGLPPVGCECEYSLNGGKTWWKCKIDYIVGTQGVVMLCDTFEGVQYVQFSSYGNALKFRPIRSEADRKRDDICDKIYGAMTNAKRKDNRSDMAEEIYDAIAAGKIPGVNLED